MENRTVTAIFGMEPRRADELPMAHVVGVKSSVVRDGGSMEPFGVVAITRREENFGTYGVVWFDVHSADRVELSVQAMAVADVHYAPESVA